MTFDPLTEVYWTVSDAPSNDSFGVVSKCRNEAEKETDESSVQSVPILWSRIIDSEVLVYTVCDKV